jgi:hypothetical protein
LDEEIAMAKARRHSLRVDANQAAIVAALRGAGAVVEIIGQPLDLLVGYDGRWVVVEVKDGTKRPSRRGLTEREGAFIARASRAGLPYAVVESVDQALRLIGVDYAGS